MQKVLSRACVVAIAAWLAPAAVMAAPTKPTVKIVGEVTITFGADGSMSVKTGKGAVTTVDYAGGAAAPKAKTTGTGDGEAEEVETGALETVAKTAVVKPAPVAPQAAAALDAPMVTSPTPGAPILKLAARTQAAGVGSGGDEGSGGGEKTTQADDDSAKGKLANLYAGTGAMLSWNVSSPRADAVKFVTRKDGEIMAQIQKSEDVDVSLAVETHYLLQNQNLFEGRSAQFWGSLNPFSKTPEPGADGGGGEGGGVISSFADGAGKILACGPFAVVGGGFGEQLVGCGPLFTAVLDSDETKIDQFGLGWALGIGKKEGSNRADFGVGIGVLFNTDSKVIDSKIIDPDTMLVRSNYRDLVTAGTIGGDGPIAPLVTRPSKSLFVMVSKAF